MDPAQENEILRAELAQRLQQQDAVRAQVKVRAVLGHGAFFCFLSRLLDLGKVSAEPRNGRAMRIEASCGS